MMANLTQKVKQLLKQQILSGRYRPGDCIPSERLLVQQFRVSRVTMRRSLKLLIEEGLLVNRIGSGYFIPTSLENVHTKERSDTILFLQEKEHTDDPNLIKLWHGARSACLENGKKFFSLSKSAYASINLQEIQNNVAGIISDATDIKLVSEIQKIGIPIVQIYTPLESLYIDSVLQDDITGIKLAYDHLIERGHRRICFFDKSRNYPRIGAACYNHTRRKLGYQFAADLSGTYDPNLIININTDHTFVEANDHALVSAVTSGATALIYPSSASHQVIFERLKCVIEKCTPHRNSLNAIKKNRFGIISWGEPDNEQNTTTTRMLWDKEHMGQEGIKRLLEIINVPHLKPITLMIPVRLVQGASGGRGPYYNKNLNNFS